MLVSYIDNEDYCIKLGFLGVSKFAFFFSCNSKNSISNEDLPPEDDLTGENDGTIFGAVNWRFRISNCFCERPLGTLRSRLQLVIFGTPWPTTTAAFNSVYNMQPSHFKGQHFPKKIGIPGNSRNKFAYKHRLLK